MYEIFGGSAASTVILHVPHASTHIPPAVRRKIRLKDHELATEVAHITDAHTDVIAQRAAQQAHVTPFRFVNRLSRLVVDPERFPDDREEMAKIGMGAVYTRTTHGDRLRDEDDTLLGAYFHPYAKALTALVDERLATTGTVTIVDVHSYPSRALPYELHKTGERPRICLGTDPFHTPPELLEAARSAFRDTELNTPFSGTYVPMKHYGRAHAVRSLMIEVRRDTYMDEPGGPTHDGLAAVVDGLADLINRLSAR